MQLMGVFVASYRTLSKLCTLLCSLKSHTLLQASYASDAISVHTLVFPRR